jgi:hypothetical protein
MLPLWLFNTYAIEAISSQAYAQSTLQTEFLHSSRLSKHVSRASLTTYLAIWRVSARFVSVGTSSQSTKATRLNVTGGAFQIDNLNITLQHLVFKLL